MDRDRQQRIEEWKQRKKQKLMHELEGILEEDDPFKLPGLANIKTSQKAKLRSKPKVAGQEYLEIYMLVKERERLKQFLATMRRTTTNSAESLADVGKDISKAERGLPRMTEAQQSDRPKQAEPSTKQAEPRRVPMKPMKGIVIDY